MSGRPSDYTQEIAADICARLAAGEPLVKICRDENMPGASTVYRWIADKETFRDMYTRAREDQADTLADQIIDIADQKEGDITVGEEGIVVNTDHIQRARLRVDARKWIAAKLKPKKYGDRVSQEISGPDGTPVQTQMQVTFVRPDAAD